jgi:hypothetical protein
MALSCSEVKFALLADEAMLCYNIAREYEQTEQTFIQRVDVSEKDTEEIIIFNTETWEHSILVFGILVTKYELAHRAMQRVERAALQLESGANFRFSMFYHAYSVICLNLITKYTKLGKSIADYQPITDALLSSYS